jgi:hypothetical protein
MEPEVVRMRACVQRAQLLDYSRGLRRIELHRDFFHRHQLPCGRVAAPAHAPARAIREVLVID